MTHHQPQPGIARADLQRQRHRRAAPTRSRDAATRLPMALAVALVAATSLAGCAKHNERHFVVGSVPETYKTRHPIILDEREQTLDIPVASGSVDLPLPARSAIKGFVSRFKNSASGMITIMLPSQSGNAKAAERIAHHVHDEVVQSGVPSSRIAMITYYAGEHGSAAPIRLSYNAVQASVKRCGEWAEDMTKTGENRNYGNFGCATQSNLAAIIANPADLLGPRGTTPIDAARRGNVFETYRNESPTLEDPPEPFWEE